MLLINIKLHIAQRLNAATRVLNDAGKHMTQSAQRDLERLRA